MFFYIFLVKLESFVLVLDQDATLPAKWKAFKTVIFREKVCFYWTKFSVHYVQKARKTWCMLSTSMICHMFLCNVLKVSAMSEICSILYFRKMGFMILKKLLDLILMVALQIHLWKGMTFNCSTNGQVN